MLYRISNIYNSTFTKDEKVRNKKEVTLTYHEVGFSNVTGPYIRKQDVTIALLDENADRFTLNVGDWLVAELSMVSYDSKTEAGRKLQSIYLDRFVPVTDWNQM